MSRITAVWFVWLACAWGVAQPADAQIGRRLRNAVQTAERNVTKQVTTVVGEATACAVGDRACVEEAQRNGDKVVVVDNAGNVITDENGNPITDPTAAAATQEKPGEGRWANYDFLRGERPIYNTRWNIEDTDNPPALKPNPAVRVGRIPDNVQFTTGNMQIVRLDGLYTAEFTTDTRFRISLSEPLPADFSVEATLKVASSNADINVVFEPIGDGNQLIDWHGYAFHYLSLWRGGGVYLKANRVSGAEQMYSIDQQFTPIKFQVDDGYAILYIDGNRVAQVPNFTHPVGSNTITFVVSASTNLPAYIRDIRVDYGVEDPVSVFESEGVYVSRSIYFGFNSADLRPESTPELERIRTMIVDYGKPVVIEGHTDAIGSDQYNLDLSTRRAEAVKSYLVRNGVSADLVLAVGKGETQPIGDNSTDDGRQMNRRVEVKPAT